MPNPSGTIESSLGINCAYVRLVAVNLFHNCTRRAITAMCLLGLTLVARSTHGQTAGLAAVWGEGGLGQTVVPLDATNLVAIAAGADHNVAIRPDGTVVAWGDDTYGQASVPAGLSGVVQAAGGISHSLVLKTNGTLVSWGDNTYGQQNIPAGLSNVTAVAAYYYHSLALRIGGTVVAWGQNGYGEGVVPTGLSNVTSIAAGGYHNLALRADGTVFAWGLNRYGQTNVPPGLSNVVSIAAGTSHSLALRADGTIVAWGANTYNQATPPPGISNAIAIAASEHSLALLADGSVVAWGDNSYGQCDVPSILSNATAIAAGEVHSLALVPDGPIRVLAVPASQTLFVGSNAVFSVSATGGLPLTYQWFRNGQPLTNSDRVGGATDAQLILTNVVFSDQATYTVTLANPLGRAACPDVNLVVLGAPIIRQPLTNLTAGAGTDLSMYIDAVANPPQVYQWTLNGTNLPEATNNSLSLPNAQPSDSGNYSIMVSNAYGAVFSTSLVTVTNVGPNLRGLTFSGAVGSDWYNQLAPVGGRVVFQAYARGSEPMGYQWWFNGVPSGNGPQLGLGPVSFNQSGYYEVAITNDFGVAVGPKTLLTIVSVMTWTPPGYSPPPAGPPPGVTNLVALSAGYAHVVGLRSDGTVSAWSVVPVPPAVTNVPAGLSNVTSISAYDNYTFAVRRDGTVVSWGGMSVPPGLVGVTQAIPTWLGGLALLTNGTVVVWGHEQPQPPPGLSNVVAIASGDAHRMALKSDGTVVVWGAASNLPGLSNVVAIAAGNGICLALKADGTVRGWNSSYATPPRGLSNVVAIAAGSTRSLALGRDGTITAWGSPYDVVAARLSNVIALAAGYGPNAAIFGPAAPAILQQPQPQTVWAGSQLELHVVATGLPPLAYQWYRNGAPLPGATAAAFTLAIPSRRDSGVYSVSVTNFAGSVLSSNALVTVLVPQRLTGAAIQPDGAFTFYAGDADGALLLPSDLAGLIPQTSTNLRDWSPLTNSITLSNGVLFIRDAGASNYPARFYRVVESRR
jgi:alpha-tubulin suppressor-like RCC1 family protein